jgi:transcriptional regulator with XRE-family HTH domain
VDGTETGALGQLLRESRQRSGLTQRELAARAGLSVGTIRDLEQGRSRHPHAQSMEAIADVLGLTQRHRSQLRRLALRPPQAPPPAAGAPHVSVLGPLAIHVSGTAVPIGTGRHRIVLARLALTPNHSVSREELIGLLWPGDAPASAPKVVQTHVSRLRRLLERGLRPNGAPALTLTPGGYCLRVDEDRLDLLTYQARLAQSRLAAGVDSAGVRSPSSGGARIRR